MPLIEQGVKYSREQNQHLSPKYCKLLFVKRTSYRTTPISLPVSKENSRASCSLWRRPDNYDAERRRRPERRSASRSLEMATC